LQFSFGYINKERTNTALTFEFENRGSPMKAMRYGT